MVSATSVVTSMRPDAEESTPMWQKLRRRKESFTTVVSFTSAGQLHVSRAIADEIDDLLSQLDVAGVQVVGHEAVQNYLFSFPDLIDIIPKAIRAVYEYFSDFQLLLKIYIDPESDDRYLALYVWVPRYDDTFLERLEKAETRFLQFIGRSKGWLQLTTDFQEV